MRKIPLLQLLVQRYPGLGKDRLYASLLCGEVFVDGERIREGQKTVSTDATVEIRQKHFVSRGGEKLDHALNRWNIPVDGKIVLDVGASTGGFTDCLLKRGAKKIYAVDSGKNQIAYSLRIDPRVSVHEKTPIRNFSLGELSPPDFAVMDISFQSLIEPVLLVLPLTKENLLVSLLKPQFEWKSAPPEFDGVVREKAQQQRIVEETVRNLQKRDISVEAIEKSPLPGRRGNTEFLLLLHKRYG